MSLRKGTVVLTQAQREALQRLLAARKTPQGVACRARIVLMSADGASNRQQAAALEVDPQRVRRWRRRWEQCSPALLAEEEGTDEGAEPYLDDLVLDVLSDLHRAGPKPKFTPEQMARIIGVATEKPGDCGRAVSHWTPRELAEEAVKRGIVESISIRQIARFFGGGRSEAAPVPLLAQLQGQRDRSGGVRARREGRL